MILYDNSEHVRCLLQVEGSVVFRTLPWGLLMAGIAEAVLLWLRWCDREDVWRPHITSPWAANSVSFAITFAIVFRTNIAWRRYWDALGQTQLMHSKWADCFAQVVASINSSESRFLTDAEQAADPEPLLLKCEAMAQLRQSLAHYFSILSAMASQRLTHGDIAVMCRHAAKFGTQSTLMYGCCKLRKEWSNLVISRRDLRFRNRMDQAREMPRLHEYALQDLGAEIRSRLKRKRAPAPLDRMKSELLEGAKSTRSILADAAAVGTQSPRRLRTAGTRTLGTAKTGASKLGASLAAGVMAIGTAAGARGGETEQADGACIVPCCEPENDRGEGVNGAREEKREMEQEVKQCVSIEESAILIATSSSERPSLARPSSARPSSADGRVKSVRGSVVSNLTWHARLCILGEMTMDELEKLQPKASERASVPDRVSMVSLWISEDINTLVSIVTIAPPIMSRCYQLLSAGVLGYNQSLQIADIPFPLPFSQLLEYLLLMFTIVLPAYTALFTGCLLLTPFLAFCVTVSLQSLTEISRELENPFQDGPNQLPIVDAHERFVELIRSVYHTRKPRKSEPVS